MSTKSNFTKSLRVKYWLLVILDVLILNVPTIVFFIIALTTKPGDVKMIILISCMVVAALITIFNLLSKRHIRCTIWIIVIGLYVVLKDIMPLIICLAVAAIIDDLVLCPMIDYYKIKLVSSKMLDEREDYEQRV